MLEHLRPPPGAPRILATTELISTVGDGVYYVTAALYFTRVVGLSPAQLGGGLTIAWLVGLAAGVPLGHLADRRGPRGTAIVLAAGAGVAVSGYLFIRSFPLFVLAACLYTMCQRGGTAAQQALLAGLVDKTVLVRTRAVIQVTYNFGLAIGAAAGGVALLIGSPRAYLTVFAVDAASFLGAALLLTRVSAVPPAAADRSGPALPVLRDRPYAVVSLINTVLVLHVPLIDVALPLWVVLHTHAPRWIVAALFMVNTLLVVALQVRVSQGVTDLPSATRFVRRAGLLLLAACVIFAASAAAPWAWLAALVLLLASAVQAVGEMVQFSGTWQISFGLAPDDKQGQYQAFFGNGMTIAEMIGPLLLTALLVYGGPPGWLVLGAAFAAAGAAMGPAVRWAQRSRPPAPAATLSSALAGSADGQPGDEQPQPADHGQQP